MRAWRKTSVTLGAPAAISSPGRPGGRTLLPRASPPPSAFFKGRPADGAVSHPGVLCTWRGARPRDTRGRALN